MSATNRGSERNASDYYQTPEHTVLEFLQKFWDLEPEVDFYKSLILDPCAGGDADREMAYPEAFKKIGVTGNSIDTMDVREDSKAEFIQDYLTTEVFIQYDLVISNPPFNQAIQFVKKAIEDTRTGGFVCFLLRLSFLGSQARRSFFQEYPPKYIIVHSKRPCFMKGGSDAAEYAHFVWQKNNNNQTLLSIV